MTSSAFWFYGRLAPEAATRFNVQEFRVDQGVRLEVFHDGMALWSKPGAAAIDRVEDASQFMRLVVAAYGLVHGTALDFSMGGWVEATKATFEGTMVGFGVDPRGHDSKLLKRSRRTVDMRRAARLATSVRHQPGWRLAVRDVYASLRDRGDDAYVFAYRAIEDVARAVSGQTDQLRPADWRRLHTLFGVSEPAFRKRIASLEQARHAAGHGNEADPQLQAARDSRDQVLDIGRRVVAEALERGGLPLRAADLR